MTKTYQFTTQEQIILREALSDYKHHLKPDGNSSDFRVRNYRMTTGLLEQFKTDVRLSKCAI